MFGFFDSPLQRALKRGLAANGDLAHELRELNDYSIKSAKDARAIAAALKTYSERIDGSKKYWADIHALVALFQDVEGPDVPAVPVLIEEAFPKLCRIYDKSIESIDEEGADCLLFALKVMAMYGVQEGAERIVHAARRGMKSDGYMWHVILANFSDHPQREFVLTALSRPLVKDFIAVALLDTSNDAAIKHGLEKHPFDTPEGYAQLERWLENRDPDKFSYAHSATAALPFVSNPARDRLLALAMDHLDGGVQLEAAWAAGKMGREAGLKMLARACLDVNQSETAQHYLQELGREDMIPPDANDPDFQAKAKFSQWLAHPNELARAPDSLEIVDHRRLYWPPAGEELPMWVILFHAHSQSALEADQVDCGIVGHMTWCFFSYKMNHRPPEDIYAIQCYWELTHDNQIQENDEPNPDEYGSQMESLRVQGYANAVVMTVCELSPKLNQANRLFLLASATRNEEAGYVVMGSNESVWYPQSDLPDDSAKQTVLKIEVGRRLLGFTQPVDRQKFLKNEEPQVDPVKFVEAYEQLVAEASNPQTTGKRKKELLGSWGQLGRHFDEFAKYVERLRGKSLEDALYDLYVPLFASAQSEPGGEVRTEILDEQSFLGARWNRYIDIALPQGRRDELIERTSLFETLWNSNLGYSILGDAWFKLGQQEKAKACLLKLREECETFYRGKDMDLLAEILIGEGQSEQAKQLLIDCLLRLQKEIAESKYATDRQMFAANFAAHRAEFTRLLPGMGAELSGAGVLADPLQQFHERV